MSIGKGMTCEQAEALLGALVDGELNKKQAAAVREHLGGCPSCARKLPELERMSSLLADAVADEPLPPTLHASVMRVVCSERPARVPARKTAAWRQWSAVAACVLCFVVVAVALLSNGGGLKMETAFDNAPSSPNAWMDSVTDEVLHGGAEKGEETPDLPMMPDTPSELMEPEEPSFSPDLPTADEAQRAYKLCRADGTTVQTLNGEWIGEELRMIFDEQAGEVNVAHAAQSEMRAATFTRQNGVLTLVYADGTTECFAFEWKEGVLWLIRQ